MYCTRANHNHFRLSQRRTRQPSTQKQRWRRASKEATSSRTRKECLLGFLNQCLGASLADVRKAPPGTGTQELPLLSAAGVYTDRLFCVSLGARWSFHTFFWIQCSSTVLLSGAEQRGETAGRSSSVSAQHSHRQEGRAVKPTSSLLSIQPCLRPPRLVLLMLRMQSCMSQLFPPAG